MESIEWANLEWQEALNIKSKDRALKFIVCPDCGSVVTSDSKSLHISWHDMIQTTIDLLEHEEKLND